MFMLLDKVLVDQLQDVLVLLLEIFVGLASFTGCLVAVDKLYLFYATVFYKAMATLQPNDWEPTSRYPKRWRRGAKPPKVCVQLPMFNETFVARRVIDYACRLDWPREKLYIQCLDDSTDLATRKVVDDGVAYWRERGIKIEAIRRTNRQGYKAGAMHEVHDAIPAEFIAIFDADFLPEPDFLMRAIPVFQVDRVPVPCTRMRMCMCMQWSMDMCIYGRSSILDPRLAGQECGLRAGAVDLHQRRRVTLLQIPGMCMSMDHCIHILSAEE